jgi:hypothetical protein
MLALGGHVSGDNSGAPLPERTSWNIANTRHYVTWCEPECPECPEQHARYIAVLMNENTIENRSKNEKKKKKKYGACGWC